MARGCHRYDRTFIHKGDPVCGFVGCPGIKVRGFLTMSKGREAIGQPTDYANRDVLFEVHLPILSLRLFTVNRK